MTDLEKDLDKDLTEVEAQEEIVVISDEDGNETFFRQEEVVAAGKKNFAILVEIDPEAEEDDEIEEENVIVAKIEFDENGEEVYVEPTDEDYAEFQAAYEKLYPDTDAE